MKIKFLKDSTYEQNDPKNSRQYKAGETYDLPDDHAQRWLRRNAAVEVEAKGKSEPGKEALVPNPPHKGQGKTESL